jgi:RIO kinase 1
MSSDFDLDEVFAPFVDLDLISEVREPIKSGKEATVYRCRAGRGRGSGDQAELALKVYRARSERSFKNDALYREGSMLERIGGGNTRAARALRTRTRFGRAVQETTWTAREWEVLSRLHGAGMCVPEPVHASGSAVLMELFTDDDGAVAKPLIAARLAPEVASALFDALCLDVERMLWLDVLHGDLSPYNILWNGAGYRVIDFPQAVDPRFNGNALRLLERDLLNIGRFCARFATVPEPVAVAAAMWERFQYGEAP